MTREQVLEYVSTQYAVSADYPWDDDNAVIRHRDNKKWFGVILNVKRSTLGLDGNGRLDIINLKASPLLIPSLIQEQGIYPAYHMNKTHWITVRLDGSGNDKDILGLIDLSYDLTSKRK